MPDAASTETTLRVGALLAEAGAAITGAHEVVCGPDGRIAALRPIDPAVLTPGEARHLLMPALTNAHDHGRGLSTLACGIPDLPLESWMSELSRQPRVDPYRMAATALARMAGAGVCAVYHCHNTQNGRELLAEAQAVSRAARDVGVRVAFAWPFFDHNPAVYGALADLAAHMPPEQRAAVLAWGDNLRDCATNLAWMEEARAFEHGLFALHYHPVAPQWARPETLAAIAQASAQSGRRVHMHLLETRLQREWADHTFPQGLLPWLDDMGLLSPRLTVAHGVWLREEECALLAARGVCLSVNVSSNLRLRSGLPPLARLRAGRVPLALGLDGMALDDDADMLREMRLAHLLMAQPCEADHGPVAAGTPHETLKAVWATGRQAILGEDGGGRIAVGAPADLLAIDTAALAPDALEEPLEGAALLDLLMGRVSRSHVAYLIVAGREVARDGACTGIDAPTMEQELLAEARAARRASPPNPAAIAQLRAGIEAFYAAAQHRGG